MRSISVNHSIQELETECDSDNNASIAEHKLEKVESLVQPKPNKHKQTLAEKQQKLLSKTTSKQNMNRVKTPTVPPEVRAYIKRQVSMPSYSVMAKSADQNSAAGNESNTATNNEVGLPVLLGFQI